jgi:hypothetical protein
LHPLGLSFPLAVPPGPGMAHRSCARSGCPAHSLFHRVPGRPTVLAPARVVLHARPSTQSRGRFRAGLCFPRSLSPIICMRFDLLCTGLRGSVGIRQGERRPASRDAPPECGTFRCRAIAYRRLYVVSHPAPSQFLGQKPNLGELRPHTSRNLPRFARRRPKTPAKSLVRGVNALHSGRPSHMAIRNSRCGRQSRPADTCLKTGTAAAHAEPPAQEQPSLRRNVGATFRDRAALCHLRRIGERRGTRFESWCVPWLFSAPCGGVSFVVLLGSSCGVCRGYFRRPVVVCRSLWCWL